MFLTLIYLSLQNIYHHILVVYVLNNYYFI